MNYDLGGLHRFFWRERVISLATVTGVGAWSAPVYYCLTCSGFVFLSKATSSHMQSSEVGFSIFSDTGNWRDIKGVQGRGTTAKLSIDSKEVSEYLQRFDFISKSDLLKDKLSEVHFYILKPSITYWQDNSTGLGGRILLDDTWLEQIAILA